MQQSFVKLLFWSNCGATSIEYALIASFISVVIVASAGTVGTSLIAVFNSVAPALGG